MPGESEQACGIAEDITNPFIESNLNINDLPTEALHLIFGFLAPRELCRTSAVCKAWKDLNKDASANRVWESHYAKRWRAPVSPSKGAWQMHYSQKMRNARAFSSRGLADVLYGHSGPVFAISLLPACNLLATGGSDCTVRLWDLEAGLPTSSSRKLGHTVRALSLDEGMLACGGGQDGAIRLWRSRSSSGPTKFDLALPTKLRGHTGPVISLAADKRILYSGSWDCSVRLWNKSTLRREALLAFPDWVHQAKPCGGSLLVTAGQTLYICDGQTGQNVSKHLHSALPGNIHWEVGRSTQPLQVDGSQDGRLVFLAGSDGAVVAVDPRSPRQKAAVLWDQNSPVRGLSFEDPWLAAATFSGSILLMDVEAVLRGGRGVDISVAGGRRSQDPHRASRQRFTGPNGSALCVDIADSYLACGSDDPVVRTWNFRQPEKERRRTASAPRNLRNTRRLRNRFVFDSSSDEEDEDSPDGVEPEEAVSPRSNAMHLSQSLPSRLNTSQCRNGQSRWESGREPETRPYPPNIIQACDRTEGGTQEVTGSCPESAEPEKELAPEVPWATGQESFERSRLPSRPRGALVPLPLRCRAEARRMLRRGIEN